MSKDGIAEHDKLNNTVVLNSMFYGKMRVLNQMEHISDPDIRISEYQNIRISEYPNIWLSEYQNIRISEYQNIRISEYLNIWISEYPNENALTSTALSLKHVRLHVQGAMFSLQQTMLWHSQTLRKSNRCVWSPPLSASKRERERGRGLWTQEVEGGRGLAWGLPHWRIFVSMRRNSVV